MMNKIFLLSKHRKFKENRKKDNSYLSYMKGMITGYGENKILLFPTHKVIKKNRERNNE
jgi:hypothetical protein